MKLSKREWQIYQAMRESSEAGQKEFTVDDIADIIWPAYAPPSWETSIVTIMGTLRAKTQTSNPRVVRTSGIGRGQKAVYELRYAE